MLLHRLPILTDINDAIAKFKLAKDINDALIAHVAGFLANEGLKNSQIRANLALNSRDKTSYYIRAGKCLSLNEINTWYQNPTQITLGHVRLLVRMAKGPNREKVFDRLRVKHVTVSELEKRLKDPNYQGIEKEQQALGQLQEMLCQKTGLSIRIDHKNQKGSGVVKIAYKDLEILDGIVEILAMGREYQKRKALKESQK
ncbi:hypothetical protein [Reinekea sp. G2M2-21]|uniref:hypothetical protein n=1 Tax=Reinekea sp. G2M2-21 TaxID=2788942 RepID=UPI0018AB8A32|nr:hypothetical protein [Reinekea sp. G2M2-21]